MSERDDMLQDRAKGYFNCFCSGEVQSEEITDCPDRTPMGGAFFSITVYQCNNPGKRDVSAGFCPRGFQAPPLETGTT